MTACCGVVALLLGGTVRPVAAGSQASPVSELAAGQREFFVLRGNTRPEAKAVNDRGRVADDLTLRHMMLQLRRTPEREQALQQFIKELHDPASPLFHHWITAAEFGQKYGASAADVADVTTWLESEGFKVNLVYPNQMVIDFTGSAGQIQHAFRTEIHHLRVKGEDHIANMSDPQIPTSLAPVVAGVVSLHDFMPQHIPNPRPSYTLSPYDYTIVPVDLWTIYNFNPVFGAGISGQGQTIVVLEQTDLYSNADWETFRSVLGIASVYPEGSLVQIHPDSSANNCADPGVNAGEPEAAIDVEWATAAAPSAAIELASCAGGAFLALQNLLNGSDTPPSLVSISLAGPESGAGATNNAYYSSLYQQAVTEGVSIFVGAGDWGAATSDIGPYAKDGINVNAMASTPYNVAVGGTDFADMYQGTANSYWSSVNAADYGSAVSYIPEIPWNNSCGSVLIADYLGISPTYGSAGLCNDANQSMARLNIQAGGGGPSACATGAPDVSGVVGGTCAGYAKPWWQSGLTGNPNDGVRDLPDVSLFSASALGGHSYVLCYADPNGCGDDPSTWSAAGGTSVTAPIMAGIQALVNQATGSRWGNPNPAYYSLAAEEYGSGGNAGCNSTLGNTVASSCVFYDVNQIPLLYAGSGTGGDIDVPCNGENCYRPSGTYGVLSTARQTLTSAYITGAGSGYTSLPSCTLSGGDGSGAACAASTTAVVASVSLTNGGSGYTSIPDCTLTGGGGTGATCSVLSIAPSGGAALAMTVVAPGNGYSSAPSCAISGGGGTGATCTATVGRGFMVSLTAPGSGYTTLPQCVLSGGGGTGATCAVLAENTSSDYQPAYSAGPGWDFATGIGTVNVANLVARFRSGDVAGVPMVSLPSSLTFPTQLVGTSSGSQSLTLTNTGNAVLTITSITAVGDFSQANSCGASVDPAGNCTISVTFKPTAAGTRTGTVTIADNAPDNPQVVTLSGTGTMAPAVSLSAASIAFGAQISGTNSSSLPVTLSNTGNAALTIASVTTSGDFSQTNTCGTTLSAGKSCTILVTFKPTAAGTRNGTLSIADNAAGSPQSVTLTGVGEDFTVTASSPSVTVIRGQVASYTLNATGEGGMSGTVNFTCTGAPSEATCTVSPNPATLGTSATQVTVTVTTTAPSLNLPRIRRFFPVVPLALGLGAACGIGLILVAIAWTMRRRGPNHSGERRFATILLAPALFLVLLLAGCGGGGGGGGGVAPRPGTPTGNYTLTVTGTAGSAPSAVSHSVTLTLTVN